ncbi:MAG: cysteinylglycine-S-conjugate dipeptidase [Solirubrobacterales bacterium]|jgi:acetylornithine deacetylase/succinyl-diaminopimelate desuccinylase-like protein|nr:cysteinylglycine-S-conjugate dipeptidase [Solirubrobacterales bacterium]
MAGEELRERVRGLMPRARADLERLVAIPSVADPAQYPPECCIEAAEYVRDAAADAGIPDARLLDMPDGHPAVFGHAPGPEGAPTVLLYCHYDVQPPLGEAEWESPPFELTERGGRWYGRGSADCKGNAVAHLTALRALEGEFPCGVKFLAEGAEEQATGGLESFVPSSGDLLAADAIVIGDAGNCVLGVPTLTTTLRGVATVRVEVSTLEGDVHSGMFGGPAPDALVLLTQMLATLHDERGNVTVDGIPADGSWAGADYPAERFRADARMLDGVELAGDGTVADMVWARPSVNVLGIDCPPVVGSTPSLQASARARVSMRIPAGIDPGDAQDALAAHLEARTPLGALVEIEREGTGAPFAASTDGPAYRAIAGAMQTAFGAETTTAGQGGSIPLCNVLADAFPDAEIVLLGVEEPLCAIHAPNESVDPSEIENIALAEALFLRDFVGR